MQIGKLQFMYLFRINSMAVCDTKKLAVDICLGMEHADVFLEIDNGKGK